MEGGATTDGESDGNIDCMVEDDFSTVFMFSTIYLRLEGKVPTHPLPQEWKVRIRSE